MARGLAKRIGDIRANRNGITVVVLACLGGTAEHSQYVKLREVFMAKWLAQQAAHSQSRVQDYFAFPSVVH